MNHLKTLRLGLALVTVVVLAGSGFFLLRAGAEQPPGYRFIAAEQHAAIALVGYAWAAVVNRDSNAGLWQDDGSHPTTKGTYLAACVFYATFFAESRVGLKFRSGLSESDAAEVQAAAAGIVIDDPSTWRSDSGTRSTTRA
jgi:hypothetical protein